MNDLTPLTALLRVQTLNPTAIIAGGSLRDLLMGKEVKDIDIFVEGRVDRTALLAAFPDAALESYSQYLEYISSEVGSVWSLGTVDGTPLQLIELVEGVPPVERAKEHDFGICQVWSADGFVEATTAFYQDCADRTFTLTHCASQAEFDRSMRRYKRLTTTKYAGFALVIPKEFEQWTS